MRFINHLTKEYEVGIPDLEYGINSRAIILNGDNTRFFLITGFDRDKKTGEKYTVVYEITRRQFEQNLQIHELLI